jgi:hypothetical protein
MSNHKPFQGTHATQQRMQQQWKQTSDRWSQKSRDQGWKNLQAQRQYQLAGENARQETLAAAQATSNQSAAGWQNPAPYTPVSRKRVLGIMLLIAILVLVLGAVIQARSHVSRPGGTPGVISAGANIRTGPGKENSIVTSVPAGTTVIIGCSIQTPAGQWYKLISPYAGRYISSTLVDSIPPVNC